MANSVPSKLLTVFVLVTFLFSLSCSSTRVISTTRVIEPNPDTIQDQLWKGEVVTVYTKDGQNFEFKIVNISSEAITGVRFDGKRAQQILPLNEIAKIKKITRNKISQPSNSANVRTLIIVGLVVVAFVIAGFQGAFGSDFGDWF